MANQEQKELPKEPIITLLKQGRFEEAREKAWVVSNQTVRLSDQELENMARHAANVSLEPEPKPKNSRK